MKKNARSLMSACLISTMLLSPLMASANIVNGTFEDGLNGWTLVNEGSSNPISLGSGSTSASAGTINPSLTNDSYAYTSQTGAGRSILYQTFTVSSGVNKIFFDSAINNGAGSYSTPNTLDYAGAANQQARFDILKVGSSITSMDSNDIIVAAYRTEVGDPATQDWTTREIDLTTDLSAYVGQDVILRYVQVDNQGVFNLAIDNVNVGQSQVVAAAYFAPVSSVSFTGGLLAYWMI